MDEDGNQNFRLEVNAGEDLNANGKLDTFRDPFRIWTDEEMIPANIGVTYIDDWDVYHLRDGEVHCSSNEKRQIPTQYRWWDFP